LQISVRKKPGSSSRAFFICTEKEKKEMARKKGFYAKLKAHVKPIGKRVKLTIYLPQGASSNLFSEIKSSVRKKRVRKQAAPELVVDKPAA
jgi:hypothetical protein